MFKIVLVVLSVVLIGYILYKVVPLIISKYFTPVEQFKDSNPAPVTSNGVFPSDNIPRRVSPGGPHPPNSAAPSPSTTPQMRIPDETASDPLAETNTEVPMKDNLRHPERMFSPPPPNTGTSQGIQSGISGPTVDSPSPAGKFTEDFLQNGGEFMKGVFAHDLTTSGENFAEI